VQRYLIGPDGAERLARVPLFEGLSEGQRRMLSRIVHGFDAQSGETIIAQDERGYEFTVIEEGEAEVIQNGRPIRTLGPGDIFGELAILADGIPRTASVVAKSNIRGITLSSHFVHDIKTKVPLVGERIEAQARERLEHDSRGT
jgi:CRP-like cAMP-binding protein